jgi:head-tail adaptor
VSETRLRRYRITILKRVESTNSVGELLYSWEKACTVWAELHDGDYFTTRFFGECFPGWRAKMGEDLYEIVGVIDIPQKTRLVKLIVKRIQAGMELLPARPRWTARQGFLGREANTAISELEK